MNRPSINQPSDLWLVDGSLRDVCVFSTALTDWDAFLGLARTHPHQYLQDGVAQSLPSATSIFQDREHSHLLSVLIGSVKINCHFFMPEEIELDIDPREVTDSREHGAVLEFIEQLAHATRKDAAITPENAHNIALLQYEPVGQVWLVHDLPANSDA